MKKFSILLMLTGLFLLSETAYSQKLFIHKQIGATEEHLLNEIKRMEIKDMADNYIMLIYSGGNQTGNHSTSDIDSIKFASGDLLVYHAGVSIQYNLSSLDSVVFKMGIIENIETVTIGNQVWTKKNLDLTHYRNGDTIPQVTSNSEWESLKTGAWCYFNNDPDNGAVYGKLYNWYAVNDSRGLAPSGYHVPSDAEWTTLSTYLGGDTAAGGKLKETGTTHWFSPNFGATNTSGFSALPGGFRYVTGGSCYDITHYGYWWSASQYVRTLYFLNPVFERTNYSSGCGLSVRCVKD